MHQGRRGEVCVLLKRGDQGENTIGVQRRALVFPGLRMLMRANQLHRANVALGIGIID